MKVISVENVSKKFILAHNRQRSLADTARNLVSRQSREDFWALKDVSFEVEQGEAMGIIGHNGAGKSTMLKLLTGIIQPTSGRIRTRGRVSALIEVGAGFHPEMTGRENIYLNGSILGMTRREIDSKFDEIVAFAELERFIDTPVKRYSSGMYVRLGFAVAAHTEPEILLVDEVLSVGDSSFQAKCATRIAELQQNGVTCVFVSHSLSTVDSFCDRAIVLHKGSVFSTGSARTAIDSYLDLMQQLHHNTAGYLPLVTKQVLIERLTLQDANIRGAAGVRPAEDITLSIDYTVLSPIEQPRLRFGIFQERYGTLCQATSTAADCDVLLPGKGSCTCVFHRVPLRPRSYQLWFSLRSMKDATDIVPWQRIGTVDILDDSDDPLGCESIYAPVLVSNSFTIKQPDPLTQNYQSRFVEP